MALAPIMIRIVGCIGKFHGYLPEAASGKHHIMAKKAVSKRLANHHRLTGIISVLYAHAKGSYGGWPELRQISWKEESLLWRVVMGWQDSVECRSRRSDAESPEDPTIFRTFCYLFANTRFQNSGCDLHICFFWIFF